MIKDIIVNLSVTKEGSVVEKYAVSVAAALEAHLTGVAFITIPSSRFPAPATFRPRLLRPSATITKTPPKKPSGASPPPPTGPGFPPNR